MFDTTIFSTKFWPYLRQDSYTIGHFQYPAIERIQNKKSAGGATLNSCARNVFSSDSCVQKQA